MCEVNTILMVVGMGMQAQAQHNQGKIAEQTAENNAIMAEHAAKDALARGEQEAIEVQRRGAALKSKQRVAFAANGMDLGYGTTADILDQTDFFTQADVATTRTNAGLEAWRYRAQGTDTLAQGKAAKSQANLQAAGTLVSGAGKVADSWYTQTGTTKKSTSKNQGWP
jgi:hypothetical protein